MNKLAEQWLSEINSNNLDEQDTNRSIAYARDLERGLATIRTFPQGVTIFGSARLKPTDKYYESARKLGALLAQNGHAVITGGGPGIMEAANRGAFEYGGRSIGLNIQLAHEQHPNPYLTDMTEFRYFFARKVMLVFASKVYVFMPGGFGTLDEFSEVLLLMQEGKMPKMPMFLIGKSFWSPLLKFFNNKMYPMALIHKRDEKIFTLTDDITEVVKAANKIGHPLVNENFYDDFSKHI